ncbi:MAG TPA: TonB-dependent receptor, partial [Pyrinomonadaceae bacterium]|nr:TonB-dependent receptor [Pyrinomonadaceae bacterium]
VRTISFSDGEASHDQIFHQHALYVQDDWKVTRRLTLNLGLRWDANVGSLPDQTNNRTIKILQQLNDPFAQAIVGDTDKLSRKTPSWTEFQPRVGFAFDPWGNGKTVIRGGYGIFYDQLFQNLTIFSLTQSQESIYQQALTLTNSAVGVGQLSTFRYGVDPLPTPPAGFNFSNLGVGGFGRINDPDMTDPYIQKFSFGFQTELMRGLTLSSDYVHTLGLFEPRVQNINPQIRTVCDPNFLPAGQTPNAVLCPRGASSRRLDRAFLNAGLPANRLEQINMIGTTNRSLFDSWTTQLKLRRRSILFNASYVLASSRSWGGQPTASYSGNGIAITPQNQFKQEEFGPTRLDERHRIILSGVVDLPWGFQVAPILQYSSARPFSPTAGVDLDGDGLATNDRLCEGSDPVAILQAMRNRPVTIVNTPNGPVQVPVAPSAFIFTLQQRGCRQTRVNSQRKGFIVDANGNITERDGRYFNVDVRVAKDFRFGERFRLSTYVDLYNVFNTENLAFAGRPELSPATNTGLNPRAATGGAPALAAQSGIFLQPVSLFGPGFGPPVGRPFTMQLGARFTF